MRLKTLIIFGLLSILILIVCVKLWSHNSVLELRDTQFSFKQDSAKVDRYNAIAFRLRLKDPNRAIRIAKNALKLASKIRYNSGIPDSYRIIGLGNYYIDNHQAAIDNFTFALQSYLQLKDSSNVARVYNNIGALYKRYNTDRSLQYFIKALNYTPEAEGNEEQIAGINFNMGGAYLDKNEYAKSLIYFENANKYFSRTDNTINKLIYLQSTGRAYYMLKDYVEARRRLLNAVNEAKRYQYYEIIYSCYFTLIEINIQEKDFEVAGRLVEEGLLYSEKNADADLESGFRYAAFELAMAKGNESEAIKHLIKVHEYDSTQLANKLSTNIDITSVNHVQRSKLQENEAEIAKTKYQNAKNNKILISVIILSGLAVLSAIIFYLLQLKKRKKERLIMENEMTLLEQKAVQAMMNPHFIFNVMTSIQQFINIADQRSANALLTGFASLIRKHLELCIHSTVSIRDEVEYLRLYLAMEQTRFGDQLTYQLKIDKDIDLDEVLIPSMLIQPHVENAIWHGIMPLDKPGKLTLDFKLSGDFLYITVIDNGIGILNSKKAKKPGHISRGMELTKSRINLMNKLNPRAIEIKQEQTEPRGTRVQINLPV